jgi:hypothetical protein
VVIALPFVLLATAGAEPRPMPAIAIDSCVDVDAEEVRRLAAIELVTSPPGSPTAGLDVAVGCTDTAQELTVTDLTSGHVTARSIDLNARFATDRDAKTRELALAIAELVRRAELEGEHPPAPKPTPPLPRAKPPRTAPSHPHGPEPESRPWRAGLGVAATAIRWTGGEVLLGVDAAGRVRFGERWIGELRLGGRKTQPVSLRAGTLDAHGVSATLGLSLDVAPFLNGAGVAVGARLGADWLRYSALDARGTQYGGADAAAFHSSAGAAAFIELSRPLCLTADAAVGTALHTITITDNGTRASRMSGVLMSGALGLSAHF